MVVPTLPFTLGRSDKADNAKIKQNLQALLNAITDATSALSAASLTLSGALTAASAAISGALTVSGLLTASAHIKTSEDVALYGSTQVIADDSVYSFTPSHTVGVLLFHGRSTGVQTAYGIVSYRTTNGGNFVQAWVVGAVVETTTGALAGTTGTDTKMTISTHTDGKIYIENRLGASLNPLAFQLFST